MTISAAPGVTGPLEIDVDSPVHWTELWLQDRTGPHYGYVRDAIAGLWGVSGSPPNPEVDADTPRARAIARATTSPHVAVPPKLRPQITGHLAEDVHAITGLTWRHIADLFGITERAVAAWPRQGVPRHRAPLMEALRAIGAMLVGGLGPEGVNEWLQVGEPSRAERLRSGDVESVVDEARSYADSPAT